MTNNIRSNKKAFGFFSLLPIFIIVLLLYFIISYQSSNSNSIEKIKAYNMQIKKLDQINKQAVIDKFYKEEILKRLDIKILNSLGELSYLPNSDKLQRINDGCRASKIYLWYNQSSTKDNCLPSFSDINSIIENQIQSQVQSLTLWDVPTITTNYIAKKSAFEINLSTIISSGTSPDSFNSVENSNISYDLHLDDFKNLSIALTKVLPKVSSFDDQNIITCMNNPKIPSDITNKEDYCIGQNILTLVKKTNPKLDNKFNVKVQDLYGCTVKEDLCLNISFTRMHSNRTLSIGAILKSSISPNAVSFSLSNLKNANNMVQVSIQKPNVNFAKMKGFIILYSYKNFLDPNSNEYKALLTMFKNPINPLDISKPNFKVKLNAQNINPSATYHIFNTKSLQNITMINVDPTGFSTNVKNVDLYQIFNPQTQKFETFDSGKKIYVSVLGYDSKYSFDFANSQNKIQSISPKLFYGPQPIPNPNSGIISGSFSSLDKSIRISLPSGTYDSPDFASYDIYLFNSTTLSLPIPNNCVANSKCEYINGSKLGLTNPNLDLILTSDSKTKKIDSNTIIYNMKKIPLVDSKKYSIAIIPKDKSGNRILNTMAGPLVALSTDISKPQFYYLSQAPTYIPYIKTGILVKNNQ